MIKQKILVLLGLVLTVQACGPDTSSTLSSVEAPPTPRQYWESIAPQCAGHPSKGDCDDGDMVLFAGLMCASGDARGCDTVRASQGSNGRWWRSPRRKNGNLGQSRSFSRDMAMGVMLYLVTTRDTGAARRWMDWIDDNRPCVQEKPWGGGCLIRGGHRFCTDESNQSCTLTPANWGNLGRVYQYLGMNRKSEMRQFEDSDGDALPTKAKEAPLGYELHLAGVEVLLKQKMSASRAPRERAAQILVERQPNNPFFRFLHFGPTGDVRTRTLQLCPNASRPTTGSRRQWSWERDTAERAWQHTSGWDCIALANLAGL